MHTRFSRKPDRRRGFTLIEILVVLLLVGLVVGFVGTNVFGGLLRGQKKAAEIQIKNLQSALNMYQLANLEYPDTLEELAQPDPETGQPFLDGGKVPLDPWNNDYFYEVGPDGVPVIISYGKDGSPGGDGENADISSQDI